MSGRASTAGSSSDEEGVELASVEAQPARLPAENGESDHAAADAASSQSRERWPSKSSFLLSAAGAAIGLGNVVRFPTEAHDNGGGVFVLAYLVALGLLGIPMLLLEFSVGQRMQTGVVDAFRQIRPSLKGVGWAMCATAMLITTYYNVLMAWSIRYLFASMQSEVPWTEGRSQAYFDRTILELPRPADGSAPSISDTSRLVPWNVLSVTLAWMLTFGAVHKGIKSSSKVVWVTVPLPFVLLLVLLVRGLSLEGASVGVEYYLKPDMVRIVDPRVWTEAFTQIFYSIAVGIGLMSSFASFNPRHNNVWRDTLVVGLANSATSIVAGFAVFSVLGHIAHVSGREVEEVARSGLGLAFVAFPEALAQLPAAPAFSFCFFLMLLLLGVDSAFAMIEAVTTVLKDTFGHRHETRIAAATCAAGYLVSFVYVTDGGYFFVEIVDHYVATYLLLPVGLAECVAVAWIYGAARFAGEMERDTGVKMSRRWRYLWLYVTPGLITVAFVTAFVDDIANPIKDPFGRGYPVWANVMGFLVAFLPIVASAAWSYREHALGRHPLRGAADSAAAGGAAASVAKH